MGHCCLDAYSKRPRFHEFPNSGSPSSQLFPLILDNGLAYLKFRGKNISNFKIDQYRKMGLSGSQFTFFFYNKVQKGIKVMY